MNEITNEFYCPISQDIMDDPVITSDGHTYERECIIKWFKRNNTSPLTGEILKTTNIIPNITLKKIITDYKEKNNIENKETIIQPNYCTIRFKNGIYYGEIKKENNKTLLHGHGEWKNLNGGHYIGCWEKNKKCGKGTYNYSNGSVYIGNWKDDHRDGKGTMYYKNKTIYEGNWKMNKKSGFGTCNYYTGNVYKGLWNNDIREGLGTFIFNNGNVIKCIWKKDKIEKKVS